ncbi:PREDICTED: uncharacterized protein LOC109580353 isoform X2 [Amphimedon queenslandica]|uniref:PH domain-containing protein n=1 Tax=Amphimedon queenslandica TaxID=400682 RepID=A0AAN0IWY3_AMPQE|nr:PREDICTED: uncharacterized protein LOC109580353 isoform X2 [Amphimedon queenslandica]|eukprot:XP_019848951.1 PREDICTED: uncharacterized protein LOC109580353 isoform X2 [Amphimedon queenslandica]
MASPPTSPSTRVYKEGILLKRARGLRNRRNIKWQERYCKLTAISLDYYDPKKMSELKGQFKLEQISIVEIIAHGMFDKLKGHPFQIGDLIEVMYFAAKSPQERNEWMEAFRMAAIDKGNELLLKHHPGVYGLTNKDRWSCCGRARRECEGCADSRGALKMLGKNVETKKDRSFTTPMDFVGIGDTPSSASPLKNSRDDLSSSMKSDASDTTLTDQFDETGPIRRTYTISNDSKPKPHSAPPTSSISPKSPTLSDTIEEADESVPSPSPPPTEKKTKDASPRPPMLPDDMTRSGASSPALNSGRGTSSRPRSMDTTEGDNPPSTPHSLRSNFTTVTTDSDPTKSLGHDVLARARAGAHVDSISIMSDASANSGFSATPSTTSHVSRIKRGSRPQSILMKDGIVIHVEAPENSTTVDNSLSKLHQACRDGNLAIVQDELDTGAPVEGPEMFNGVPMLPLFLAFLYDHRHIISYLLDHGADPNSLDISTRSCLLHMSCQKGCMATVKCLLAHKADIDMRSHDDKTPLCEASKHGHMEIVKLLINSGAIVECPGISYSPLHYASEAGHVNIVQLLLDSKANSLRKTQLGKSPYQLAFENNHSDVMYVLQRTLPPPERPYQIEYSIKLPSDQVLASISFLGDSDKIITGSWDGFARLWSVNDDNGLHIDREFRLPDTVLSSSFHPPFLALGSASIQVIDTTSPDYEWRRTVADDSSDDENLSDPPLHFVAYTSSGHLISASVESNLVKIWPLINKGSIMMEPEGVLRIKEDMKHGRITRLSVSPCEDAPWLAAVLQPGSLFVPEGNQKVHIYNWKEKKVYHILDTGKGGLTLNVHVTFSPNGQYFLIGYINTLTKWRTSTGESIKNISSLGKDDEISSLCYSPNGEHIAVGLASGDIHIIHSETGSLLFTLRCNDDRSAVRSLCYSSTGLQLASGHSRGSLQLWKVFGNESN